MPKVSIIIPAYNQARFLATAIESALRQTHPDVEVVVVDDGSPDATAEVAARFSSHLNLRYVRQANTGLPGARNRGLRESTGEFVCFLDADDFFHPEKIARQVQALEADPGLDFVYCDIIRVDEAGEPLADSYSVGAVGRPLSGNIFQSLLLGGYFPPHTVLIRRKAIAAVGEFDPDLGGHADYDLWLRVSGAGGRAGYLDEKLAYYRTHANNMSNATGEMAESRRKTLRKIARLHPELVGEGIHGLQKVNQDLFHETQWLNKNWRMAVQQLKSLAAAPAETSESFLFLEHHHEAKLLRGQPDQFAIWDATLDGVSSQALYLQSPAMVEFDVPVADRGELVTAVALHPKVWNQPASIACEFNVRVDERVAFVITLDPALLAADRLWHELKLPVPETTRPGHRIVFETRALGNSADFRWALWRAPKFSWSKASLPDPTPRPATASTSLAAA